MQISKTFFGAVTVALLSVAASSAQATTTFDQPLTSIGGWFDGSGNPNGGFTIGTDNGYTIALRAKGRQNPLAIDSPTNTYSVPTGAEPGVPTRAWWNYEFSIACDTGCPGNPGGLAALLADSTMTVTDLTKGTSGTVSMLFWLDDSTWGPGGVTHGGTTGTTTFDTSAFIAQNSENPVFGAPMPAGFNMNDNDAYNFLITLMGPNKNVLDTDNINVLVGSATLPVPEPVTISLFAAGLAGVGALRFRRKRA